MKNLAITIVVAGEFGKMLDYNNIFLSPSCNDYERNYQEFDVIGGNQFYFNQITGDLFIELRSTTNGTSIVINEKIVDFFSKIECSVLCGDSDTGTDNFGLLVNIDNK